MNDFEISFRPNVHTANPVQKKLCKINRIKQKHFRKVKLFYFYSNEVTNLITITQYIISAGILGLTFQILVLGHLVY